MDVTNRLFIFEFENCLFRQSSCRKKIDTLNESFKVITDVGSGAKY